LMFRLGQQTRRQRRPQHAGLSAAAETASSMIRRIVRAQRPHSALHPRQR
jgi:hypothetical protein